MEIHVSRRDIWSRARCIVKEGHGLVSEGWCGKDATQSWRGVAPGEWSGNY